MKRTLKQAIRLKQTLSRMALPGLCWLAGVGLAVGLAGSPAQALDNKLIASVIVQQDQFFKMFQAGMEEAAKKAGVTLLQANSDSKPDKEQTVLNTYITRGVGAIIISPISEEASAPVLKRAAAAGIKVVTYNTTVAGDVAVSFLNSDQEELGRATGRAAAKLIKEKLGGKAKIGVLQFKSLFPEQSLRRVNGFLSQIKADGVEVVADQDAWLAEKGVAVAGDIITANSGITILFGANEGGTVGAVQAVRNAKKQGKIFVFGVDGSAQLAKFLLADDNVLQATTAQQPYQIGVQAMETAVAAIAGNPVEKQRIVPVRVLDRGNPEVVKAFEEELKKYK